LTKALSFENDAPAPPKLGRSHMLSEIGGNRLKAACEQDRHHRGTSSPAQTHQAESSSTNWHRVLRVGRLNVHYGYLNTEWRRQWNNCYFVQEAEQGDVIDLLGKADEVAIINRGLECVELVLF
jgi:hypothetical protein